VPLLPPAEDGDEPGAADIVQFGNPARPRLQGRWTGRIATVCLLAAAVLVVVARSGSHHPTPPPPVSVTDLGHPILGVRAGWELLGLDGSGLVSVQFARGRITRTVIPKLTGDGLVSLVAARGETFVRPLDPVTGYVVPDGQPARLLTGVLAQGGILLPGPSPSEEWFDCSGCGQLLLIGPHGVPTDAHLAADSQTWLSQSVMSDGRGGVVLVGPATTLYDAAPRRLQPIGALLIAVGPRNMLGLSCSASGCQTVVINAATGTRRALPGSALYIAGFPWQSTSGVVAPDGSSAAVIVPGHFGNQSWLEMINLRTGTVAHAPVPVSPSSSSQSLAWSPDSRWLFVVTATGGLAAVDGRSGLTQGLDLGLSGLRQIVTRAAAG
jgi:hypothetical protein